MLYIDSGFLPKVSRKDTDYYRIFAKGYTIFYILTCIKAGDYFFVVLVFFSNNK